MTELKTLKDLDYDQDMFIVFKCRNKEEYEKIKFWQKESGLDERVVKIKDAKEEAIKWVNTHLYDMPMFKNNCSDCDGVAEEILNKWIKTFFNITEEDLKN